MKRFNSLAALLLFSMLVGSNLGCEKKSNAPGRPVIAAILMQQDQFFRLNEEGMKDAAARLGVDLRLQNASGALDKEINLVETFVPQKVGAILVSPLSSKASVPALRRAHEAGIKIVTYNNDLSADFQACSISSDQEALGAESGRAARQYVETKLAGKAKVALIGFVSQLPEQGGARLRGFKSALSGMPGVEIVAEQDAWMAPQAATVVAELLTKNPDVIWAANDGGTVGAVTAVRNAGKAGKVAVFGTDVSKQILDFLLADDGVLHAVTAQKPFEMGASAVEAAVKLIHGEKVEPRQSLTGVLFTRDRPEELKAYRDKLSALGG